jgi:hypothetical protein
MRRQGGRPQTPSMFEHDPPTLTTEPSALLGRLAAWPFLRVERRGPIAALRAGPDDAVIGTLDLRTGVLVAEGGLRLEVADGESGLRAEALLRARVRVARFGVQMHEASP